MYQVEDKPETIHLYVVREQPVRPRVTPIILSLIGLSLVLVLGITTPYTQPVTRAAIRVSAVPLGVQSFTASVLVIPTGTRTYPATTAHGTLTITNGSIIAQVIPSGFTVQGVATDRAVFVPAGDANGYGHATVSAHALLPGKDGNFSILAINQVAGSSVYIRNLSAFHGGQDAYSVKYVTEQNKQTALMQGRNQLAGEVTGLHYPCQETKLTTSNRILLISWRCQFVRLPRLTLPNVHIITISLLGRNLVVDLTFTPLPRRIWVK